MKTVRLTLFALFALAASSFGQTKPVEKVVIKTPTILCQECQEKLENYLKREPGIMALKVDYKRKITTVTFMTDRNNIEQLKTAISNAGFDADEITADEAAYKKLPKCCRSGDGKKTTKTDNQ